MGAPDAFGDLRSLLNREPSVQAWQLTCALLENMSGAELEDVALPYAAAHTTRWPAHLCRAPRLWLERALAGTHEPRMAVVRAIIGHFELGSVSAARLAASTAHAPIEAFHVTISGLDDDALVALQDAAWWPALRALVLRNTHIRARSFEAMFARQVCPALHTLDLSNLSDKDPLLWHLLARHAARLPALRIFAARESNMGDDLFIAMAEAGLFTHATALYLTASNLSEIALAALAGRCPQLDTLCIDKNPIPAIASRYLTPAQLPALRFLDASSTQLTAKARGRYERPSLSGH
jgi:hypothetical protein